MEEEIERKIKELEETIQKLENRVRDLEEKTRPDNLCHVVSKEMSKGVSGV